MLKDKKITRPYVKFEKHLIIDFEVIGNLYENPELLKDTKWTYQFIELKR